MAAFLILFPAIFNCFFFFFFFFFFFSLTSQDQLNNNHDQNSLILEFPDAKLKLSRLESVLEERIQSINAKTLYLKESEKLLKDMANYVADLQSASVYVADLQSALSSLKVRLLWAVSRKNNFELHVLESKAQDAEDRLEFVTLKVEKMAEVVTEQWIQIQYLEQALQIGEMRALQDQRQRI